MRVASAESCWHHRGGSGGSGGAEQFGGEGSYADNRKLNGSSTAAAVLQQPREDGRGIPYAVPTYSVQTPNVIGRNQTS